MSDDLSLFGDEPVQAVEPTAVPMPIADWLVQRLREALDARGLTSMQERQQAIEAAAGRPVESLRSLTQHEGFRVLSAIGPRARTEEASRSAWDNRDEATWIDRI